MQSLEGLANDYTKELDMVSAFNAKAHAEEKRVRPDYSQKVEGSRKSDRLAEAMSCLSLDLNQKVEVSSKSSMIADAINCASDITDPKIE